LWSNLIQPQSCGSGPDFWRQTQILWSWFSAGSPPAEALLQVQPLFVVVLVMV
jgi:hypothetical protein